MKTHEDENKELIWHFLNRTFFKDWKSPDSDKDDKLYNSLELATRSRCNLNCTYCYYNDRGGHGKLLHPPEIYDPDTTLKNVDKLFQYLSDNDYYPGNFELFGGEVLIQPVIHKIIEKIIEFYKGTNKRRVLTVPTNMSFLRNKALTEKIKDLMAMCEEGQIPIHLSASFDGKYMDPVNRPLVTKKSQDEFYNDEFYDKIFSWSKNQGGGFHPMIHHGNIEKAWDNFLWFQENFKKHNIPWNNVYLLEVRNDGWTKESVKHYMDYYKKVLNFSYDMIGKDNYTYINYFIFNAPKEQTTCNINKMNMFNNIGTIGRGMGCSIQTTMQLRISDLVVTPCHRQSYDAFNGFKFLTDDKTITDIEPMNINYYFNTMAVEHKTFPYCESCLIKHICMAGCMGSQFEAMGDPNLPIPSVCLLKFGKVKAQIEFLEEHSMFNLFCNKLNTDQSEAFKAYYEILYNGER